MSERVRTAALWTVAIASMAIGTGAAFVQGDPAGEARRARAEVERFHAVEELHAGDARGATAAALDALALDPSDAASWELLGELRRRQRRLVEARLAFERAVELDRDRFRSFLGLAEVQRALGAHEAAEAAIARARELAPNDPAAIRVSAELAVARGDLRHALDLYRNAERATRGRRRAAILERAAAIHARLGEEEAAARALGRAAEADPGSAARWARAAAAFARIGDQDAAREADARARALARG